MTINKFYIIRALTKVGITRKIALFFSKLFSRPNIRVNPETMFKNLYVEGVNYDLKEKGYALGIQLPKEQLNQILDFCKKNKTYADDDKSNKILIPFNKESNPSTGTVYRYTGAYNNCEAINNIAHDPKVIAIAKHYLGTKPRFIGSQMWWSYPKLNEFGDKIKTDLYGFHYDIDDLKFIKLFFYLNDVDQDRGPHVIIGNSHKAKDFYEIKNRRISDEIAEKRYKGKIKIIEGSAGTGFFEDTFCYHKGTHPNKRRLLLQFEYAINNFSNHDD